MIVRPEHPGRWAGSPIVLLALALALGIALACPAPPAEPGPRYQISVLRSRMVGAAMLRFDSATGRVWLQPMERRATPWKPLGDHSQAPSAGEPGRFELTTIPRGELVELLRFDTALGLAQLHDLTGEEPGWRDIDQTQGAARGPGAVEPGGPGRYSMQLARTNIGARMLRIDTRTGKAWTMPFNGIGGWMAVEDSADPYTTEDMRFPEGAPSLMRSMPVVPQPAKPAPEKATKTGKEPAAKPRPTGPSEGTAAPSAARSERAPAVAGAVPEEREEAALIESLHGDLPPEIRAWAATELGEQGRRDALPELRRAMSDPAPEVATAAARAVERLGGDMGAADAP